MNLQLTIGSLVGLGEGMLASGSSQDGRCEDRAEAPGVELKKHSPQRKDSITTILHSYRVAAYPSGDDGKSF